MTRSRTLSFSVKRKTGEAFDAILNAPSKMIPDAKKTKDGWWNFTSPRGPAKLKFNENKQLGILDYLYVDSESKWNVPMRVIPNGDESEIIITLIKPDSITDEQFNERMDEIGKAFESLKELIETPSELFQKSK
ncbi:hypothetical protein NsoK4_03290 [Nitrosopumilus sp. K4]|uniref:hypothetical protein n=1 Tax=Nitrosopumilus sp. K4 TaxID=2795383 RepID=UPI001BACDE11|nr:hypothetical protein [Nitrosopumilus sp. K4]QUC65287.1 hypothetical protein NsoK4_03290 [Nitrosopumilus sp. K4]